MTILTFTDITTHFVFFSLSDILFTTLGFGVEAVCFLLMGWITELKATVIIMIVGVGIGGIAIFGKIVT